MPYLFTKNWFKNSGLHRQFKTFINPDNEIHILEIGAYEGASTVFMADNALNHPKSTLITVDPFDETDTTTPLSNETEQRFKANIANCKWSNKITHKRQYSNKFFEENTERFDFIYIDGSHLLEDITADFNNALKVINNNGIIWIDDYLGASPVGIKAHIDNLIMEARKRFNIEVIHKGYQIAFRASGALDSG